VLTGCSHLRAAIAKLLARSDVSAKVPASQRAAERGRCFAVPQELGAHSLALDAEQQAAALRMIVVP